MNKENQTVKLEFDIRLFELLSKDLYKNKLSFLRELCQNSADAHATEIQWILDEEEQTITEIDNGCGMNYEFLLRDWCKVGKSFKTKEDIGFYGIGRLSAWLVASKCWIRTNNAEIDWNSIGEYELRKTELFQKGLAFKIYLKDKHKAISQYDIMAFLESNINLPKIQITVNSREVTPLSEKYRFKVELPYENAMVWIRTPSRSWEAVKVFEKGLKVTASWNNKIECLIDFNKTIKTLSRESLTITDEYLYETIFKAYLKIAEDYLDSDNLRESYFEDLSELQQSFSFLASKFKSERLAELVPIRDKLLRDFKGFFYSKPSGLVCRAKEKGYNVLVIQDDDLAECCNLIGLKSLTSIRDELKEKLLVRKTDTEKGKRILEKSAKFMEFMVNLVKDLNLKLKANDRQGKVLKSQSIESMELMLKEMADSGLVFEKREEGSDSIKYTLGNLAFGESEDENTVAWQSRGYTVLNLNNSLVQTLIRTERLDLIEETLTHEFVHRLGYSYHDNDFTEAYTLLRTEALKNKAEVSAIFENKVLVSKISKKYKQASVKIPKEVLERLDLEKGTEVKVTIQSYGKEEE